MTNNIIDEKYRIGINQAVVFIICIITVNFLLFSYPFLINWKNTVYMYVFYHIYICLYRYKFLML